MTIKGRKGDIGGRQRRVPRPASRWRSLANCGPPSTRTAPSPPANASGINDGAAAVVLMSASEAAKRGMKPLARIASWATAGVDRRSWAPARSRPREGASQKAGWKVSDLDLIEANEAFAAQACVVSEDSAGPAQGQRQRRRDRHRPPDRRLGRAHPHHPAARDAAARRRRRASPRSASAAAWASRWRGSDVMSPSPLGEKVSP